MKNTIKQSGAVSLFVVIFAALLITVVTVSFVRIMIQNQQQATATDLSQSAFDSAQAGVEDAKRAILQYKSICDTGNAAACATALSKIGSPDCNVAISNLDDVTLTSDEVKVQTTGDNGALDQAYVCVKVDLNTLDVLGKLVANESNIVPLTGTSQINKVRIEWFRSDDISSGTSAVRLQTNSLTPLLAVASWEPNKPSIMRTQLIQFSNSGFKLDDFDDTASSGESNSNTVFLYPSLVGASNVSVVARDVRRDVNPTLPGSPVSTVCFSSIGTGRYACTVDLILPTPIGGGDRNAYLRLTSLYNGSRYRISLFDGSTPVEFKDVQPSIDSTGRANDLFRRVVSRVALLDVDFTYPEAAIDVTGNLCKNFMVTDVIGDFVDKCTP